MKIVYLDAWAIEATDLTPVARLGEFVRYDDTEPGQIAVRVRDAAVIITNKVRIGGTELDAAPECRLVLASATGTDHIDAEACRERGVAVRNVAGYATESVAQYTVAAAMHLRFALRARHERVADGTYAKQGRWTSPYPAWSELGGMWGIVGLGAIGRRVGELARALGCETTFYSASGPRRETGFRQLGLRDLLSSCDVVSVHAPGAARYLGLLNREAIGQLKPTAALISAGRGGIIDEAAVAEALASSRLGAAAFDVFASEPPAPDNPLLGAELADRVLLTPHMAWTSREALSLLVDGLVERIREFAG